MNQEKIGKFISKIRKESNLTQEQFAEAIGVNSRSVSRWENGRCMPDLSMYEVICKTLNISINELLAGERIDECNYQKVFEANVIKIINSVDERCNLVNRICKLISVILIVVYLIIGCVFFYKDYYFVEKYDRYTMSINDKKDDIYYYYEDIGNKTLSSLVKYYAKEDIDIVFVQSMHTLYQNRHSINTYNSKDSVSIANKSDYDNKNFRVYYTNVRFNKIRNANSKELEAIIKKSVLIFEQ